MVIFSERYKELIDVEDGELNDHICCGVEFDVKKKIAKILIDFAEPQLYYPNRYSNYEQRTTAFELALEKLSEILEYPFREEMDVLPYEMEIMTTWLGNIFTPFLFDIIELQYIELSDCEKSDFEKELNNVFARNNIPWILHDGRLIKIDAKQFELDIKVKTLTLMKELKEQDAIFQSPFNEMIMALEFFEKGSYAEAISNAGKSYESVLKILCDVSRGNADKLTKQVLETNICDIPESMTIEGFKEKVLMSLPYVRNNSTASHGSGKEVIEITKEMANLAINMAAVLNTYLIESYIQNELNKN